MNKNIKNKEGNLLQVRSDTLFHDLFNENDIPTLEWAVSKILDCKYEDIKGKVKVRNTRLTRVNKKEKNKYVDLIVEYENENIIIELNNNFNGIYTRNILYAANVLLNNYKIRDNKYLNKDYYKKVTRVLLVNLNWYSGLKGEKTRGKTIYEIPYSDIENSGYLLKIINANLDYYAKICYDKLDTCDKFYKLLTIDKQNDLDEVTEEETILKNYSNKLMNLSNNQNYVEDIMDEIIEENVLKQTAYLLGEQSGIEQNKKEIVLNMFNNSLSIELIANCTNLTHKEVEEIIENNKK